MLLCLCDVFVSRDDRAQVVSVRPEGERVDIGVAAQLKNILKNIHFLAKLGALYCFFNSPCSPCPRVRPGCLAGWPGSYGAKGKCRPSTGC